MITTAKFEKTSATVEKIVDWAISSQAARKLAEGSTTSIGSYRVVPKTTMPRTRGYLTFVGWDTILNAEVFMPRRIVPQVTKETVENAYRVGGSLKGAAIILGVSKKCVLNWMNKHGITRNENTSVDPEAVRLMAETMTSRQIADVLGITREHVNTIAREHGFKCQNHFHKGYATTHNGYRMERRNGNRASGYKLIHRAVMEAHIGRPLGNDEIVHHKNHDKTDNRIENLEIMSRSEHARLHYSETKPSPYKNRV